MDFERDVFISYAHIDNQPLPGGEDGWVTVFHEALKQFLSRFMGEEVQIWRDEKLSGNDVFSDEIIAQFQKTATLVSVLTPRYLNSEWCTKEIKGFCGAAEQSGGLVLENKARVFKVIKTPYNGDAALPPVVSKVLGYEFYELDEQKVPRELDPQFGERPRQEFLSKVNKLAWDIKQLLDQLVAATEGRGAPEPKVPSVRGVAKQCVYLAECGRDRRGDRELLAAELGRHGFEVLPDQELPTDEAEYVAEVERLLARSQLAVHLVGTGYGLVPDGPSQKSVVVLQNELAVRRAKAGNFARVIWLPVGTSSTQAPQKAFIAALHGDSETQFGADLITGDFEALKSAVHAGLKKLLAAAARSSVSPPEAGAPGAGLVYLLCDERDRKNTVPLLKALKARGFEAKLPIFTGDAPSVRAANQELLAGADTVVLFYGAGDEAWKYHQQNELKKLRGLRSGKPDLAEFIYLAAPTTDDKELLVSVGDANLIDGRAGFSESTFARFADTFPHRK